MGDHRVLDVLRKAQLVQLDILLEFDRICKENGLRYQLFAGTLLGAVRHKGFIPWDDDIDVVMAREDYDRLKEICKAHLKEGYFLQHYDSDPNFFRQFSRLRKDNTVYLQHTYRNLDIHHGIFIDVFPLDNVMPGSVLEAVRCKILSALLTVNRVKNVGVAPNANMLKKGLAKVLRVLLCIVPQRFINRVITKVITMFNQRETGFLNHLTNGVSRERFRRYLMRRDSFYSVVEWEFEGRRFPISQHFHELLTNMYGDYLTLPPEDERRPHHGIVELLVE